jgi:hypothetical protein
MRVGWGAVAQLGERLVRNEEVSGSIPLSSTKESITYRNSLRSMGGLDCPLIPITRFAALPANPFVIPDRRGVYCQCRLGDLVPRKPVEMF